MAGSPQRGGGATTIASVIVTAVVVVIMLAMVSATGGLHRPLLSRTSVVAMAPSHPRQG